MIAKKNKDVQVINTMDTLQIVNAVNAIMKILDFKHNPYDQPTRNNRKGN